MNDATLQAELIDGRLRLDTGNGAGRTLHPMWLRERCPCPECRDPRTGQRLLDAWSIPLDTTVTDVWGNGEEINISFSDGHVAPFRAATLVSALARRDERAGVVTWDATLPEKPEADWRGVRGDDTALYDLLSQLHRYGFVIVRNVPVEMDAAAEVVERIGPMRRTNWGGVADIKAIPEAYDLTMTPRTLEPHADNPYREPVPGYVFVHCLVNDVDGGELLLTDGFRVAEVLRDQAPREFDALTRVRPEFTYVDDDTILENSGPLIELDEHGQVRQLRLSNRTEAVAADDPDLLDRYYRARRRLTELVCDPRFQIRTKLQPGDLAIMDNYRMLHGRSGYEKGGGHRHLRQCYMDRDTVGSRRKVLARRFVEAGRG